MAAIRVIAGIALLLLGRRLFWLFVGALGFVAGVSFAPQFFPGQPEWVILIIALLAGLVGALLAVFLQGLAVAVSGFIAGGYLATSLMAMLGFGNDQIAWLPYVIGGIFGAILIVLLFDWALIILSSLVGSSLVVQSLQANQQTLTILFIILLIIGILIQASTLRRSRATTDV
jgi:hypothetical protein